MTMTGDLQLHDVDLTGIAASPVLHQYLAATFAFPSYYGHNWDAFDECIADFGPRSGVLRIRGWDSLKNRLPRDADILRLCLDDFAKSVNIRIEWA